MLARERGDKPLLFEDDRDGDGSLSDMSFFSRRWESDTLGPRGGQMKEVMAGFFNLWAIDNDLELSSSQPNVPWKPDTIQSGDELASATRGRSVDQVSSSYRSSWDFQLFAKLVSGCF